MGFIVSDRATKVIEQIEATARKNSPDCFSNALPNGNGFYEIDRKTLPDYGIRGTVYIFKRSKDTMNIADCGVARLGRLYINGEGRIIRFPGIPVRHWFMFEQR